MQDENTLKKHNTAKTSILSFQELSNEGRLIDEKKLVYEKIRELGPVNSRQLSNLLKKERGNITRSLYDLCNEINPSIKVCFVDKCPVTSRKVKYYSTVDWVKPELKQGILIAV